MAFMVVYDTILINMEILKCCVVGDTKRTNLQLCPSLQNN